MKMVDRTFDDFAKAEEFRITMENFGAKNVKMFAKWHGGRHEYIIRVTGIIEKMR